jgi:hypothetical protein
MGSEHTTGPWARDELRIHGPESEGDQVYNTICHVRGNITVLSEDHANAARIVACVNLLAAHPDLTRVTVVGEGVMGKIREALEWTSTSGLDRGCPYCDRASDDSHSDRCIIANAIALLPSATVKE